MNYKQYDGHLPDADKVSDALGTVGVAAITNSRTSPEEFAKWSLDLGYHLSPDIWCTDHEHSDLFWRVTNEKVDGENQGLFADYELDWHTNVTPVGDAEEIVGLYAKTITYPTETWFCNTIPYWQTLSETEREFYESLEVVLDPLRRLGTVQTMWQPNFKSIYGQRVFDDINKNRKGRDVRKTRNIDPDDAAKYNEFRGIFENHKLVPNHPYGTKGLFFTPYEVHGFAKDGELLDHEESMEIYWKLWNDLFVDDKYIYKHSWNPGDIVLMDQTLTIHRRPSILKDKPRELLRIACWYKTKVRKHTGYVL